MDQYENYNSGKLLKNRYQKVTDLSEGSYGLVTLAKDTKLSNRLVAIKYIYPLDYKTKETRPSSSPAKLRNDNDNDNDCEDDDHRKRRQDTKEILRSLYEEAAKEISVHRILGVHPNIASLYDHFDSYLVMEYCSRGDLYEAIQNGHGPAFPKDIKDVFNQILDAIEYCHSSGVYHRDLKPENVLISEDWSIKLCDWGLATTTKEITNRSEFDIGSERYMAPELFDQDVDHYDASKIDLWAIGIILLTIVFHKNPFEVANYSDKRFVQFASNRESLFDIFSTMTGDLFAVLRYCLNLDPQNRDLTSVRAELEVLNYFTIDDEFNSSDLEDYYSDEEHYHEDEDEQISLEHQPFTDTKDAFTPEPPTIVTSDISEEAVLEDIEDEGESTFFLEDREADKSDGTIHKEEVGQATVTSSSPQVIKDSLIHDDDDKYEMPYNERAEALLSNSTSLKPIPITFNNVNHNPNGRNKFFRNTRKPISVATYQSNSYQQRFNNHRNNNHNSNSYSSNYNKFNREDFFTPKSVFNHYMSKYGEIRESRPPGERPGIKRRPSNWKKNNKPKTWKKNYRGAYKNGRKHNGNHNNASVTPNGGHNSTHHNYNRSKNDYSNFSTPVQHRRKSNSFSSSKSRNIIASSLNNQLSTSFQNSVTNSMPLSGNALNGNTGTSANSYASSTGKYIPPSMRSPNYARSPLIQPLNESIDQFSLNNTDYEVFELEDDYDFHSKSEREKGDKDRKKYKIPTYNIPMDKGGDYSSLSTLSTTLSNTINPQGSNSSYDSKKSIESSGGSGGRDRGGRERPSSMADTSGLASSASGRYVPPFRRRSQSNGPISGTVLKDKEKHKKKKDDGLNSMSNDFEKLNLNPHGFSSIQPPVDWYSKNDWSD